MNACLHVMCVGAKAAGPPRSVWGLGDPEEHASEGSEGRRSARICQGGKVSGWLKSIILQCLLQLQQVDPYGDLGDVCPGLSTWWFDGSWSAKLRNVETISIMPVSMLRVG